MNTTFTAICAIPGTDEVITPRRANARLAPGGREGPRERDYRVARTPLAGEAARWQLVLDLLDPDNRCGAWSPATVQGRPVICTRAPTTLARSTPTPKPGGAGTTKRPHLSPDGSSRTQHAQASAARPLRDPPAGPTSPPRVRPEREPSHDHHRPGAPHGPRPSPPRTASHPGQRSGPRCRRRRLRYPGGNLRAAAACPRRLR